MALRSVWGMLAVGAGWQPAWRLNTKPLPSRPVGQYGHIGFRMEAPCMQGGSRLRLPRVLQSAACLNFEGRNRPDMRTPHRAAKHPAWVRDRRQKTLTYILPLKDGVVMREEAVRKAFFVQKTTPDLPARRIAEFGRANAGVPRGEVR